MWQCDCTKQFTVAMRVSYIISMRITDPVDTGIVLYTVDHNRGPVYNHNVLEAYEVLP